MQRGEDAYIDGDDACRIFDVNGGIGDKLRFLKVARLKLEEHLLLPNLSEVEFVPIKGLEDLIHTELRWPLLQVAALIQLGNESVLTRNHLVINNDNLRETHNRSWQ